MKVQEEQNMILAAAKCSKEIRGVCRALEEECAKPISSTPRVRVLNAQLALLSKQYSLLLLQIS